MRYLVILKFKRDSAGLHFGLSGLEIGIARRAKRKM